MKGGLFEKSWVTINLNFRWNHWRNRDFLHLPNRVYKDCHVVEQGKASSRHDRCYERGCSIARTSWSLQRIQRVASFLRPQKLRPFRSIFMGLDKLFKGENKN